MKKSISQRFFGRKTLMLASLLLAFVIRLQHAGAQCSLTCNSLVNVSLDQNCTAMLLPSVIADGDLSLTCPSGVLFVQAKINGNWVPATGNFVATSAHIGKTLEVRVRDLVSGNYCWGHVFIEDKLAPTIHCQDITVSCVQNNYTPAALQALGISAAFPAASDNCSTVTRTYADVETIDVQCGQTINGQSNMSYAVKRMWTATDAQGNKATCMQWIYFQRVALSSVLPPADVTLDCSTPDISPANTGSPFVTINAINYSLFGNGGFCEVNATYADQVIPVCDGTKKILRTWTLMDWCTPTSHGVNPRYFVQLIKLVDSKGPSITCPANATVSVDQNACCATVNLPDVIVTDDCSRLKKATAVITTNSSSHGHGSSQSGSYTVDGVFANFPGNNLWNPDTLVVFGNTPCLPTGTHVVTYTVTDDCGNTTLCSFSLTVRDYVEPTVVCDDETIVSVGSDDPTDCYLPDAAACKFAGVSWVRASSFDNGSYDNCGGLKFTVQRMAPYSAFVESLNKINGFPDCSDVDPDYLSEYDRATSEGDSIKFYCGEVGTTQMVIFRAYQMNADGSYAIGPNGSPIVNSCMVEVTVQDKQKPVCTAPANLTVSCETFDPSLWAHGQPTVSDNCCLDASYNYNGIKGITQSVNYSQFDTVCHRGIITRRFTAFDCSGNTSVCTQRITVTYNQDYFMHLPADQIVTNCGVQGNYGEPIIYDEDCELVGSSFTDELVTVVPDACYKIIRKWRISNWCTYNPDLPCVSIPNPNPNAILNHPSNLNAPALKVTPYKAGNTSVPVDWRSTLISINPGEPQTDYSIFWSATANCYEYNQIIKIIDNDKPVIDNCPAAPVTFSDLTPNNPALWNDAQLWDGKIHSHDLCEMDADLSITASDLCAGPNINVSYLLFLDVDGDGSMETVVNSRNVPAYGTINYGNASNLNYQGGTPIQFDKRSVPSSQRYGFALQTTVAGGKKTARVAFNTLAAPNSFVNAELPHGTHKIKWLVTDGCGNESTCEYTFTIRDGKAPTIVCLNGVAVNIMPSGMIDIWDTDMFQYTTDNCTPSNRLKTAICKKCTSFPVDAQGNPVKEILFTCNDVGTQIVRIWSQDAAGNSDYCETYILVQDNAGHCTGGNKSISGVTKGTDKNGFVQGAADVSVALNIAATNSTPGKNLTVTTNNLGNYNFLNAVPTASDITVTPTKDNDALNGVDMLDVLKIQRHILGIEPLSSPYRQIAADVNNSRSITSGDIVEMRRLILGSTTKFASVPSWRFIDRKFQFPNVNNAFSTVYPEMITVQGVADSKVDADFEAVKMGDVNGNAVYNSIMASDDRTSQVLYFDATEQSVAEGQEVTVQFAGSANDAAQFTLLLNDCSFVGTDLAEGTYAVHNGAITVAAEQLDKFSLTIKAAKASQLSKLLTVSNKITQAVGFVNGERSAIALRFSGLVAKAGFELMQNVPNPAKASTIIGFNLPEAEAGTLTFTNVEGRVLKVVKGNFNAGMNTVEVQVAELEAGVIFYQLETATHSEVKSMVVIR